MPRQNRKQAYEDAKKQADAAVLCVADVVKVLAFDEAALTVDVQPITRYPDEDTFQTKPPVLAVPVATIYGGGFVIRPVYKAGDIGVVVYLDRDSDAVIAGGAEADPNTERLHSGDDAVFVGGIRTGGSSRRVPEPGDSRRRRVPVHLAKRHRHQGECGHHRGPDRYRRRGQPELREVCAMPGAARQGDAIQGTTSGEHNGHVTPHGPLPITGTISGGCSGDVFINGRPAAYVGSTTTENDACCGSSQGSIAQGSSSVFINGKPAARIGDALAAHNGTGAVSAGSGDVLIGG